MRFGEFLIQQKLVTEAQIEDALEEQRLSSPLLGNLAVQTGMLDRLTNIHILIEQKKSLRNYGQIAKEKGLLSDTELNELIKLQLATRQQLGKILVKKTALTRFQLIMALKVFVKRNRE